ncbi:MAG: hypothetical protein E7608_05540 [Ruminococcaceae bacterium]|nr:hypothetical protein [Oscillospiraceae bacterium]
MKHSWLRLFSSVYILLVSVLLIVISAYAWMVISTSPSTGGAGFGVAGKELWNLPEFEFDEVWDGNLGYEDGSAVSLTQDETGAYIIRNGEELWTIVNLINGTDDLGDITMKIVNSIDMASETTDFELEPIYVDGQHGVGKITVIGAKTDETGAVVETGLRLKKPLFSGGFAGNSAIAIENITIANSTITSTNPTGSGAFIDYVDAMQEITLTNCHLKNSTVTGGEDSRTGALVGYVTGYSDTSDGPVKTYVTVKDCSVENSTVNSQNSAGGIIGHAGASDWTYTVVENCTVTNTKLNSTDDGWRVGEIVGTANVGEMVVKNCTTEKVELNQTGHTFPEGQDRSYGRLALGTTGNYTIIDENKAELWGVFTQLAADNYVSDNQTWILHDNVTLGSEIRFQSVPVAEDDESDHTVTINIIGADSSATASGKAEINLNSVATGYAWQGQVRATSGFNFDALNDYVNDIKASTNVTFSNIVFNNNKTADSTCETTANRGTLYTYAYAETVIYTDCTFNGGVVTYGDATFTNCSFTEDGSNMYCLFLDNEYGGITYVPDYRVTGCAFNGNSTSYGGLKVADDKNIGANLYVEGSSFENIVNKSAIYVNGKTNVRAENNTFENTCVVGDIGFKHDTCTYNGSAVKAGDYRIEDLESPTSTTGDTGSSTSGTTAATATTTVPTETTSQGTTTTTASADVTAAATTVSAETTTAVAQTAETTSSADVTTTAASTEAATTTTVATEASTTPSEEPTVSAEESTTPSEEPTASAEETTETTKPTTEV